jgi:hypothetical protein
MSVTFNTEMIADSQTEPGSQPANRSFGRVSDEAQLWIARATLVAAAAAFAWATWGHWGDFQIDNGRELYVPAEILKGKMLFRDLWYMYGPLAPYLKALLFKLFGVQLTVLYVFGLTLAVGTALLTFEVSRFFRMGIVGSLVPPLFLLTESFYPFIRNFIFPYSYAAALATFIGMGCLYFVLRHASSRRAFDLAMASLLCSLAVLTKQEFGVACLALVGFEIAAVWWSRRNTAQLARDVLIFLAGQLPAVAGYGWFVWKLGARFIFFDNWISTPGTYFMRTWGKITIPAQGLRFVPSEMLLAAEHLLLGLAIWALLSRLAVSTVSRFDVKSPARIVAITVACLGPLWALAFLYERMFPPRLFNTYLKWGVISIPGTQGVFPKGILFLVAVFGVYALWKLAKAPGDDLRLQQAGLALYAGLIAFRQMMELGPTLWACAVFFNGPAFIVLVIVLFALFRWACKSLDARRGAIVITTLLLAESVLAFILFYPRPSSLPARLDTPNGSFYTRSDVATLFPEIISFMRSHSQNGRDILMVPEPPSLYVFAGLDAPSRWYGLVPGYVAPDREQDYINELIANQVRYVLISNRVTIEYKVAGFNRGGYNVAIYNWIMAHFAPVGQFGPTPGTLPPPYIVWVYERKDLVQAESAQAYWYVPAQAERTRLP